MADLMRGGRRRYILVLMALTALTLATLDQRSGDSGPIGAAGRAAHSIVQPIANGASTVFSPVHDWWHGFWHHGDIVAENRKLRSELENRLADQQQGDDAILLLKQYDKFFNTTYWSDYRSTGATVTDASPGNNETTVTINRGSESGIRTGMAVVGPAGMIGAIADVWHGGSKVTLITDPSFGVAVRTLVDSRVTTAQTDAEGVLRLLFQGNGQPKHPDIVIKVGDRIVTCGCNHSAFPAGIPVGAVTESSRSFDGAYVRVAVMPTLDRKSLEHVKVILWRPGDTTPAKVTQQLAPPRTTTTRPVGTTTTTTRANGG